MQNPRREIEQTKEFAITSFAKDLVEVQDNFRRALNSISEEELGKLKGQHLEKLRLYGTFVEGVVMTQQIMTSIMRKHGVAEYVPLGEKFNPEQHESMYEYLDPIKAPGTIGEVVQVGYRIGKRILRAPKVAVVKRPPPQPEKKEEEVASKEDKEKEKSDNNK